MVVQIQFLSKPRFASGPKPAAPSVRPFAQFSGDADALTLNIRPSSIRKSEKAGKTVGTSVFAQVTDQLKNLTKKLKGLSEQLGQTASGTAAYDALQKEKLSIEQEFQRIVSPQDETGKSSPLSSLLNYLDSATNLFSQGLSNFDLGEQGIALFGNDGADFLRRGGADAAKQLGETLRSLVSSATSLDDPNTVASIESTVSQLDQLFSGHIYQSDENGPIQAVVTKKKGEAQIDLKETDFVAAGQIALGLRTASPADLMKAASAGIDLDVVNQLVLRPEKVDIKSEEKRQKADEGIIDLAKEAEHQKDTEKVTS